MFIGISGSGTFISCSWSGNTAPANQVSTIVSILLLLLPLLINHLYIFNPKKIFGKVIALFVFFC